MEATKRVEQGTLGAGSDVEDGTASIMNVNQLHRRLDNRQIQLVAIGGSIGTGLFISIGSGLQDGGPGSLLIGFVLYSLVLACVNNCMAEMATLHPVSGGFIRMAGKWVDDALGFVAGWNFFLYNALLIPFEITALNSVLAFWRDDIPAAAVIATCIALYAILNILAVGVYGEAEFWLSGGKVILIFILFGFTLVSMCGGNPKHDAYGFRYWSNPGAFASYTANGSTGNLARFEGFLTSIWTASFVQVGPEYIGMVAAEVKRPSIYLKNAFQTAYARFGIFYVVGALCVGIVLPYNSPQLTASQSGAAASPYVMAMNSLQISVLPHIVNALLLTSIFSAGNAFTYASTRSLYSLAVDGRAPRFLTHCTRRGVPIWSFCIVMCFPFLSFLQLSNSSSRVLNILVDLVTGGGLINYIIIGITYLFFYRACKAQGVERKGFPYYAHLQPFCGYVVVVAETLVLVFYGYSSIATWNLTDFWTYYLMMFLAIVLYAGWKLIHRTRMVASRDADLIWERPMIEAYEASLPNGQEGFWGEMLHMVLL